MKARLALSLIVAGCSTFEGRAPSPDATVSDVARAADASDARAQPPSDAAAPGCFWDETWGCNPFVDAPGCPPGTACTLRTLDPFAPFAACEPAGSLALGRRCTTEPGTARCAPGLQCLEGRCVRPCCGSLDSPRCAAADPRSACAVRTVSLRVQGCTLSGACDYVNDNCPAAQQCQPTSVFGEALCAPTGAGRADARCEGGADCARGFTCVINAVGQAGICRPRCNPRDPRPADCAGVCGLFSDRPADFGTCR